MKIPHLSGWKANLIYVSVLLLFVYSWPYTVYGKIGKPMAENTARERMIVGSLAEFARMRNLSIQPHFRVGQVPASAGAFSGQVVVIVSPAMLDTNQYSDHEIKFLLAHELGHIERYDAYRFWTTWRRDWAELRELAADRIGVDIAGCPAMEETVRRHVQEFMIGYSDKEDPHPHPQARLEHSCPGLATAGDPTGHTWRNPGSPF